MQQGSLAARGCRATHCQPSMCAAVVGSSLGVSSASWQKELERMALQSQQGAPSTSMLGGLAKARHPAAKAAAKAAGQAPAKQEVSKKRSCSSRKPARASAQGGESAPLRKGAALAPLRGASAKAAGEAGAQNLPEQNCAETHHPLCYAWLWLELHRCRTY